MNEPRRQPVNEREQLGLILREIAHLRRDWAFFSRVFVRWEKDSPEREVDTRLMEAHLHEFRWHLRNLLQDALFIRLSKLSQRGKSYVSFPSFFTRIDSPKGSYPELSRAIDRLATRTVAVKRIRDERIAHLAAFETDGPPPVVRELRELVQSAVEISEALVELSSVTEKHAWEHGDANSTREFLELLRYAPPVGELNARGAEKVLKDSEALKAALARDPFQPFRLHFGSGKTIDIENPGLVVVSDTGRTAVALKPKSDGFDVIDILLVERIEYPGNGSPSGA